MKYGHHSQWQKRATLLFWDQILRFGWNSSREEQSVKAYFCFDNLKNASSFQLEPVCLPCQGISATRFLLKKEHSELINQTLKLWSHLLKYTRVSKQTVLVVFAMVNAVIFSMSCACRKLALSSSWDSSASSFSALASESQKKKQRDPFYSWFSAEIRLRLLKCTCLILQCLKAFFLFVCFTTMQKHHATLLFFILWYTKVALIAT